MVARFGEKIPQVTLARVEDIFPDIWRKGTVHVTETNVSVTTTSQKMTGVKTKTDGQNVEVTDKLVLEAIAANKNRPVYNPHVCPACNITFKNKGRLMMHLQSHITKKKLGKKSKDEADIKKKIPLKLYNMNARGRQYSCNFCGQIYMSEEELISHKVTHFEEKYGCSECDLTFRTTIYLNIHIESVHCFNNRRKSSSKKCKEKHKVQQHQAVKHKADQKTLPDKVKRAKQK